MEQPNNDPTAVYQPTQWSEVNVGRFVALDSLAASLDVAIWYPLDALKVYDCYLEGSWCCVVC